MKYSFIVVALLASVTVARADSYTLSFPSDPGRNCRIYINDPHEHPELPGLKARDCADMLLGPIEQSISVRPPAE